MKIDPTKIDIDKCPVCNTKHDLQIEDHVSGYTVCCYNCFMNGNGSVRGPYSFTKEGAIKAWNS